MIFEGNFNSNTVSIINSSDEVNRNGNKDLIKILDNSELNINKNNNNNSDGGDEINLNKVLFTSIKYNLNEKNNLIDAVNSEIKTKK